MSCRGAIASADITVRCVGARDSSQLILHLSSAWRGSGPQRSAVVATCRYLFRRSPGRASFSFLCRR